jgi:hypothetical protein
MTNLLENLFGEPRKHGQLSMAEGVRPTFPSDREAAQFLVEVIQRWHERVKLFCFNKGTPRGEELNEDAWHFAYSLGGCGHCLRAQRLLDLIFGDHSKFNALPFVNKRNHEDEGFAFRLGDLKKFAAGE